MYPSTFAHLHDVSAAPTSDVTPARPRRGWWLRRRVRARQPRPSSMPASAAPTRDPVTAGS